MGIAPSIAYLFIAAGAGDTKVAARGSERVIHRFDFDEQGGGNLEDHPKYWERIAHPDFPAFAIGNFDFSVGRSAPPSFHLVGQGRDVAFAYTGAETPAEPGKRFRVEGFLRPDRLVHARACLSAAYRRSDGALLADTLVRSPYMGGEQDDWQGVELYLPPAPADAEAIVLTVWVLQEATWDSDNRSARDIDRVDVEGGAWFDDIVVVALPRIDVRVANGLNVLTPTDRRELQVVVDDVKLHELDLLLTIVDSAGSLQHEARLKKDDFSKGVSTVSLTGLPPGVYQATLRVTFDGQLIDARSNRFCILAPLPEGRRAAHQFGIVLRPGDRLGALDEARLLTHELVRAVKVPLAADDLSDGSIAATDEDADPFVELMKRGFDITAILLPHSAVKVAGSDDSIIDALGRDPSRWEAGVSTAAARYAGAIRWWQLGVDGASLGASAAMLGSAVTHVRAVLDRYALGPQLAAAWSMHEEFEGPDLKIDGVTLTADAAMEEPLQHVIGGQRSLGVGRVSVFAPSDPPEAYARLARLGEWVKRVLVARHAGADTVYVPQTWTVRPSYEGLASEPTEEFVLLRTLAGVIGDAAPGPKVELGDGVHCLAFYSAASAVLALWDESAPAGGRDVILQLGRATEVVDPWGNRTPLERTADGRHVVRLSQMPVLVSGVETWLVDLLTSISLEPARATPGADAARHVLRIKYHGEKSLAATVRLTTPDAWRASPGVFEASLSRGEPFEMPFELRRPHNEPSGLRQIVAEVRIEQPSYLVEIPIPFEIALQDVEVRGSALLVGDELVLRHAVRNTGTQQLHLRSAAAVPGRQRQYRPIVNLDPGESETVEYHFRESAALSERHVYLTLRELNDGPRSHTLQVVVP